MINKDFVRPTLPRASNGYATANNFSPVMITIIKTDNCLIVLFINGSILQEKLES
jgi:hypothetical protein